LDCGKHRGTLARPGEAAGEHVGLGAGDGGRVRARRTELAAGRAKERPSGLRRRETREHREHRQGGGEAERAHGDTDRVTWTQLGQNESGRVAAMSPARNAGVTFAGGFAFLTHAPMPLPPVIFEDDSLIAFDKPSGLLVAPNRWDKQRESLMGFVHAKLGHGVANVHRLDADTSGVLLCAKTKPALDFLSGQFQSKTAQKKYHAFVAVLSAEQAMKVIAPVRDAAGALPDAFTIELALGEDERQRGRMRVFKGRGGKDCATEFRTLERFGGGRAGAGFAFVECHPLTGRTHQIRVHLAAAGAPIVNDRFYGNPDITLLLSHFKRGYKGRDDEKPLLARLALHASELTVTHPLTREPVTLTAPLPHEFEIALKYLRKFAAGSGRPGR
jgi:23S rRNA pseudouridine1911/1915/1917 synthase